MALGFVIGGTLLAIVGFMAALRQGTGSTARRRRRSGGLAPEPMATGAEQGPDAQRAQALSVLQEPVAIRNGVWSGLAEVGPPRQFKMGLFVGLGAGLAVAGLLFSLFPPSGAGRPLSPVTGTEAPQVSGKAATPAPAGSGGQAPAAGKTAAAPTAPSPITAVPPPTAAGDQVVVPVYPGENAVIIANRLVEMGIIGNRQAFLDRLGERKADVRLQAGEFRLRRGMSADAVIDALAP